MYKGSCLCGGVELSIKEKITDIIHCHCSLCRKSSGTAFATNGFVNTSDFEITKGKELLSFFEVKPGKKKTFLQTMCVPDIQFQRRKSKSNPNPFRDFGFRY